ncbi:hypothetical protein C8J57DRAFT_1578133 [Mycena rebaudengoi]|nr:hypothetical protein C8J57DRAFT_1578133 [Mycena rebaudengoi]
MVTTRKTPVAPVPTGSRTNSSQAIPRAGKAKSALSGHLPQNLQNRNTKTDITKKQQSLFDQIVYFSLFLLGLYAVTVCSKDDSLSSPVCRGLWNYRIHILEPYVVPPIRAALSHPSVAPALNERTLRPALVKTAEFSAPYAAKTKRIVWDGAVIPTYNAYVVPQWRARVLPPYHKHVTPQLAKAAPYVAQTQRAFERTSFVLHQTYVQRIEPFAVHTYVFVKPHALRAYGIARPQALKAYAHLKILGAILAARAGAARREYVDPHIVRIWEKVLELSGTGPVGSPTEQAASPVVTRASSEEPTVPSSSATKKPAAVVTSRREEEVVSQTPIATQSSGSSEVPEVATVISAASVVSQSAHGAESPLAAEIVEEIKSVIEDAQIDPTPTAEPVTEVEPVVTASSVVSESVHTPVAEAVEDIESTTEDATIVPTSADSVDDTILSAASVVIESAHAMESNVLEEIAEEIAEEIEEDDGFLTSLGLEKEAEQEEDVELTQEEIDELARISAAEQKEATRLKTIEDRKDIEGRMAKSFEILHAMVVEKDTELREKLVGMRTAAVEEMDNPQSAIGSQLPTLEVESDKLLKGLEGYLKKETKSSKSVDPAERLDRWTNVVTKVQEKFAEKLQEVQTTIHQYHAGVKTNEINEGMAIIAEVRHTATSAQADVGLDLSWLDDVSYLDWQRYHDLIRIAERFQEQASAIQAGTHESSPADPFLFRLEDLHADLQDLIVGFSSRVNLLGQQAREAFTPPPPPEVETPPPAEPDVPVPVESESPAPVEAAPEPRSLLPQSRLL